MMCGEVKTRVNYRIARDCSSGVISGSNVGLGSWGRFTNMEFERLPASSILNQ